MLCRPARGISVSRRSVPKVALVGRENSRSVNVDKTGMFSDKYNAGDGASRSPSKIWVQIWAQFSLLGAPSALCTLLAITEDSSEVLCFPLAVSFTRWKS